MAVALVPPHVFGLVPEVVFFGVLQGHHFRFYSLCCYLGDHQGGEVQVVWFCGALYGNGVAILEGVVQFRVCQGLIQRGRTYLRVSWE